MKKLTVEEVNTLMDLVRQRLDTINAFLYDIHDSCEEVPEYLVKDCNKYIDIWNKLLQMKCKKLRKKLSVRHESDLPF